MESKGKRAAHASAPTENRNLAAPAEPEVPISVVAQSEAAVAPVADVVVQRISQPTALPAPTAPRADAHDHVGDDACGMLAESHTALSRGLEALNEEFAAYARHSIDTAAHTAIDMLAIRTWSDAVAVNSSFARTGFGQWLDSSAKISELGIKLAIDSSKPFFTKLGKTWNESHFSH
jgi:hypothetical protein